MALWKGLLVVGYIDVRGVAATMRCYICVLVDKASLTYKYIFICLCIYMFIYLYI